MLTQQLYAAIVGRAHIGWNTSEVLQIDFHILRSSDNEQFMIMSRFAIFVCFWQVWMLTMKHIVEYMTLRWQIIIYSSVMLSVNVISSSLIVVVV